MLCVEDTGNQYRSIYVMLVHQSLHACDCIEIWDVSKVHSVSSNTTLEDYAYLQLFMSPQFCFTEALLLWT